MWDNLLVWLMAVYGCSSLLVTLLERWWLRKTVCDDMPFIHYQVLLYNSEDLLEGVVRRLLYSSVVRGEPIRISFVDYGSTDDTAKIAAILRRRDEVLSNAPDWCDREKMVCVDLRMPTHQ
ncbi:glycosyltransferase family 2 protein [Brevibacillus humidisoli]|uniref:glycosyltransferase family 2 protein n=1 Tax=Brevibacillus humidisoli TaxID=2895522 RepID=UPI001E4DB863|nr:glycosyltransferase family 2 protein [Brevibacillus humidisoli]UFJ40066.1 glycosyltransferase family 2 protein [Brevibacillus humidisoli]